jgi:hypothetical protein
MGTAGHLTGALPNRSPGVIDRLLALVDQLPGPATIWYVAFAAVLIGLGHLVIWIIGARPFGTLEPEAIAPALFSSYLAWLLHVMKQVAGSAFDDFRPALGDPSAQERYRAELVSNSDRSAIVAIVAVEATVFPGYFVSVRPLRPPLPIGVELVTGVLWAIAAATLAVLLVQAIRELRMVSRLSALADSVDIFKPRPINALSRLTAVTAITILTFVAFSVLTIPEQPPVYIVEEILIAGLAVACFVLPLRVMHGRLLEEKNDLLSAAQDRLKAILARLHQAVEANDLAHADQLNMTLSSVLAERELLVKLPTWPWSTGTFRSVASALLLPVVIFVITRLIDQLI